MTHSVKAPGFNPCAYAVKNWFQAFAFFKFNLYRCTEDFAVKRCHPAVAYADAKKLLERHSVVLSSKFEKVGVVANAVDPGPVVSDFIFKGGPGAVTRASRRFNPAAIFGWILGKFTTAAFGPFGASKFFMRSIEHGAAAVAHVAVSDATVGRCRLPVYKNTC
jgi:NAD(P)-dependent dehydrogenase (short-subunit alcohol dehydrogenase family)